MRFSKYKFFQTGMEKNIEKLYKNELKKGKSIDEVRDIVKETFFKKTLAQYPIDNLTYYCSRALIEWELGYDVDFYIRKVKDFLDKEYYKEVFKPNPKVLSNDKYLYYLNNVYKKGIKLVLETIKSPNKNPIKINSVSFYECPWSLGDVISVQEPNGVGFQILVYKFHTIEMSYINPIVLNVNWRSESDITFENIDKFGKPIECWFTFKKPYKKFHSKTKIIANIKDTEFFKNIHTSDFGYRTFNDPNKDSLQDERIDIGINPY